MEKERFNIEESVCFVAKHYQEGTFDIAKGWKRVTAALPGFRKTRRLVPVTRVAAAILLLLVIGVSLLKIANQPERLSAEKDNTRFTLPDQTQIVMRKGARMEYGKNFGKRERGISMRGEITFAVARDETKPFIVHTPSTQIEVLGTKFTVTADHVETRLSVESGIVRFTPDDLQIPLLCTVGMTAHYSAKDGTMKVASPDSEMGINTKTQSLTFDNMALKEVVRVLSHFYNVQIELPESESDIPFSSSFTQKSLIEIISIINITLDTHITVGIP